MKEPIVYGNLLDLENDRQTDTVINGFNFRIKALFTKDYIDIAKKKVILQGGVPAAALSEEDKYMFERIATVNQAVTVWPEKIKNAESCPDFALINSVYKEIEEWTEAFDEELKKNRPAG